MSSDDRSSEPAALPEQTAPAKQEQIAAAPVVHKARVSISGQISNRGRTSSPLPRYPASEQAQGHSGTVMASLSVSPDGTVMDNLEIESSSGYPVLDDAVLSTLRAWHFVPLAPTDKQETQTGQITVRFELD